MLTDTLAASSRGAHGRARATAAVAKGSGHTSADEHDADADANANEDRGATGRHDHHTSGAGCDVDSNAWYGIGHEISFSGDGVIDRAEVSGGTDTAEAEGEDVDESDEEVGGGATDIDDVNVADADADDVVVAYVEKDTIKGVVAEGETGAGHKRIRASG